MLSACAGNVSLFARSALRTVIGALLASSLAACGFIPKDGPTGAEVRQSAELHLEDTGRVSYAFVKLSPVVLSTLQTERQPPVLFSRLARLQRKAFVRVAPSDVISVSIFEAGAGGLFVPAEAGSRPGNFVQIPPQEIGRDGNVTIPYAGSVPALGRTPREIEADIVDRLMQRAIEPQAIVTVGERTQNTVTVLGDVRNTTVIPLRPGGIRLLQALARAGGSTAADHSTVITLKRQGHKEQALLTSIIQDDRQNIELAPEDVIYVTAEPRIFMAFGAIGRGSAAISIGLGGGSSTPGQRFIIDRANMSLAEALANAGGVASGAADATSVFLFRYTPKAALQAASVDVSAFPDSQVPTVYSLDLSQAEGYFLANHFYMKHNDIIYVSESPSVDLAKFLSVISALTSGASNLTSTYGGFSTLR